MCRLVPNPPTRAPPIISDRAKNSATPLHDSKGSGCSADLLTVDPTMGYSSDRDRGPLGFFMVHRSEPTRAAAPRSRLLTVWVLLFLVTERSQTRRNGTEPEASQRKAAIT